MPSQFPTRREFLGAAGTTLAAAALASAAPSASTEKKNTEKKFKKSLKFSMVKHNGTMLEKFKMLSDVGFDGVELDAPNIDYDKKEILAAFDKTGLAIPGVIEATHWKVTFSDPRKEVRTQAVATLEAALRDAKLYGATTVLLVPAVVNKEVSYAEAYDRSQAEIRKALPVAEETGVKIAFENVWNNFLLSPLETARYIDEFNSPWVGAYFDVGNIVAYGWPEQWIRILGKRILKLDIKEYSRKLANDEGTRKGFGVELLEGDCDWPAVMTALREIGYEGWGSAEVRGGGEERLREISVRMDRCFAS
ncbi:MAG TPA: sugar phosphate isomerase/epimerase family protein [Pirellulales bacterium]|jgi:hexulose-6-phosphate isomerase|nr:sugar phosphate isomerase/epimerase family protein [Pirellulales bacterium]